MYHVDYNVVIRSVHQVWNQILASQVASTRDSGILGNLRILDPLMHMMDDRNRLKFS